MLKLVAGLILVGVLALAVWALPIIYQQHSGGPQLASAEMPPLPDFSLPDLDGNLHSLSEWQGKVLVVNFWATWCPPCKEEMPLFVQTQKKYADTDLQFLGIAIDDPDMVRDFYDIYNLNFPVLTGGPKAIELSNSMGNRFDSLPFTAVFDRTGKARYIQAGQLSERDIAHKIIPLL